MSKLSSSVLSIYRMCQSSIEQSMQELATCEEYDSVEDIIYVPFNDVSTVLTENEVDEDTFNLVIDLWIAFLQMDVCESYEDVIDDLESLRDDGF